MFSIEGSAVTEETYTIDELIKNQNKESVKEAMLMHAVRNVKSKYYGKSQV